MASTAQPTDVPASPLRGLGLGTAFAAAAAGRRKRLLVTNLVSGAIIGAAFGIAIYLHEDAQKKKRENEMRKVAFIQQKPKPPPPPPEKKPPPPPPKKKPGPKGPDKPKKQRLKAPDRQVAQTIKAPDKIPDKAEKPPEEVDPEATHMSTEGTDDETAGEIGGAAEAPPEGSPTGTGGGGEGEKPAPPPPPPPPPPPKPKPIFLRAGMPEPERIEGDNPSMPAAAVQAGIEGQVVLLIHVGTTGRVTKVQIIKKLPILSEHCERVVRTWRYKPYVHNGQAVPFIVRQPFTFKLSQ